LKSIQSAQNPAFKTWASCLESRGIRKFGYFILSGRKLVPELLQTRPDLFEGAIFSDKQDPDQIRVPSKMDSFLLPDRLFQELDPMGTHFPLLVGKVPEIPEANLKEAPEGLEVLCALGDPSNLGSLLRSCEAFGVKKVILLQESANPFLPKAIRASAGSSLRIQFSSGPSIKELDTEFIALQKDGTALQDFKWPKNSRLLMGEEGLGVPTHLKPQHSISIPIHSQVESLNAVVASSIALYSYSQQK